MDKRRAAAALLALAACITCSTAAPTAGNHTALELHDGPVEGCYYNFQHYGEGDRIMTNEPCLNCTCHNRMLMCYLRVCPFTKAIGQDCTVEKRADQCCPIVTCPDVPVDLLTSTSTTSPAEYGATGLGKLDKYGCSIHGKYFPEGSKVPPTPNKPCEHCYCIRNMTTCVMQECTLHVDGCTPIYHKDVCCPVRYSCDHPEDEIPLLDDMTTTVRPTQGFLLTTTTISPVTQMSQDCVHDDEIIPDGALIKTEKACEHCYCMKGDIVCVVQECGTPMENEGKNCTSLPPRHGQCCPDTYICEGDEPVTDSSTEFVGLTSSPPRRVGVEGSGYRNEPDEPYTEISPITTEIEGSGEEITVGSQIYTGENVTPEKEPIDEAIFTTSESSLLITEPDKGQNTIPDTVIEKETVQGPIQNEVTSSVFSESVPIASEEYSTVRYVTSQEDELITTESVLKIKDESYLDENITPKDLEKATTESTDLLYKTTVTDELLSHPVTYEPDHKVSFSPSTEYTIKVQESKEKEDLTTESFTQSSTTEKNKLTDVSYTSPEAEITTESTVSSVNPNINEIDDTTSPASTPSRIPGEGDCLLNGITYSNNTRVPSTNNCHTGCKCISSIIKCDPIICSPPPEYMENMNDCQPVYDTPNSCCPTYVCSVKETVPPESHSYMSGTESPKPIAASECSGTDCLDSEDKNIHLEPTICTSGNCLSGTPAVQKECKTNDCKDQLEISPSIPFQDCSTGKCDILPIEPCEGENCKTEQSTTTIVEKQSETTKSPTDEYKCESDDCKDQIQTTPSKPSQDCSDGKCIIPSETPCEGETCKIQPPIETISEKEPTLHDLPPKVCDNENECDESNIISPEECVGENCRRKVFPEVGEKGPSKCSGSDCKQHDEPNIEQSTETVLEGSTESDISLQKKETTSLYITTTKEQLIESELDVTKLPIYIESTTFEQIMTEPPKIFDTEKDKIQAGGQIIPSSTEKAEEEVTETLQSETQKLPVAETTKSTETDSRTDEPFTEPDFLHTKSPEYVETSTKKHFTEDSEQFSTTKPHVYTDSQDHETILEEDHTKLPELTELDKSSTELPDLVIHQTDELNTESPERITQKDEFITTPGKLDFERETEISFVTEATRATLNEVMITEKEIIQSETPEAFTEKEFIETKAPELDITEKEQQQTQVTGANADMEDTQTKSPEIFTTEKQKESIETEKPEIVDSSKETSSTESPEIINIEQQTVQTALPDHVITSKEPTEVEITMVTEEIETTVPDAIISIKEEEPTDVKEIEEEEKEVPKVTTLGLYDIKTESTTASEFSVEKHPIQSSIPVTDRIEPYLTKEPITKPEVIKTEEPDAIPTVDITEISTERVEADVTKIQLGVTESVGLPTLSEEGGETTEKETHKNTEEQEMYTKTPQEFKTTPEKEEVTTDKKLYTTISYGQETKVDDVSQAVDQSVTESQFLETKAPELLTSQYAETSTVHDDLVTDKYEESSDTGTKSTSTPIHKIIDLEDEHTKPTETYTTLSQAQDKTTTLPELHTKLVDEVLTTDKYTQKPYETPSLDLEKDETTVKALEELPTTESNKLATISSDLSTEPQQQSTSGQKIESEPPLLISPTELEGPESSTHIVEGVTEVSKIYTEHPGFVEEVEKDLTTKTAVPDTEIYKDESPTEHQQAVSQETSYTKAITEPYVETSTKIILEIEKTTQDQETKITSSQTIQSSDSGEFQSTLSSIKIPEPELVTEKDIIKYTTIDEDKEIPYDTSIDGSKPLISDEKSSETIDESTLPEADIVSVTTEPPLPNVEDSGVMKTKEPLHITMFDQTTFNIDDRVTTESHLSFTSTEDELTITNLDDQDRQKEQGPVTDIDVSLMTSTSLQPEDHKKITEPPMSIVTYIDHTSSPQTSTDKFEIPEQTSKTTVEQKLDVDTSQSTIFEIPKESTKTPDYHVTQIDTETESPSSPGDLHSYEVEHGVKPTPSVMEDEYSINQKTTTVLPQKTDVSKNISTIEAVTNVYVEDMEGKPTSDTKEGVFDTQPQSSTTISLTTEKDLHHEQDSPFTESESVTKSPQVTETILKEISLTPSIPHDVEEALTPTEAIPTEQDVLVTKFPEIIDHDVHLVSTEKESSDSEGFAVTKATEILTEKQPASVTSVYVPTVTEPTEGLVPMVTEVDETDVAEKDHKQTEIGMQTDEKTTSDEVTEKDILYTRSEPLFTTESQNIATQQKEIITEILDKDTTVPDQVISQSVSTEIPKHEYDDITESTEKDKIDEHVGTTQFSEISSIVLETQTEATKIEKTTLTVEIQPEKQSTESTVVKEISTTVAIDEFSKETDKKVSDIPMPTEFTPTTLESTYSEALDTQAHKEFDISEQPKQTTEQVTDFSETTPFLVELKEHTHQVNDDSSLSTVDEIITTSPYEPQQTERGDQNLDITDKYEDEYQTLVPITTTEYEQEDKEKPVTPGQEPVEGKLSTTISPVKEITEHLSFTEVVPTISSTYLETDLHDKEKHYTVTMQETGLTTAATPQTFTEKDLFTTISINTQNSTHPVPETSTVSTEKYIHLETEKPLKSETPIRTTMSDEDLLRETSKPTTSKIKEEITTLSPITEKSTQPEDKPIKTTSSPPTQELTKPGFDDEINEGMPSPDFPSGAGGYGQEPDYIEEDQAFGPGTCRYGGKVYVSAQQIPRDDPCDFCFCFRSDIICLQQSCPPPIHGCHEEPIQGFCCPRYECPVSMATTLNVTTTTTTTTTTLPPHFLPHAYKGAAQRRGCQIKGHTYKVGEVVRASSGPCLHCTCGGDGQMKCDPKACTPEPMLRQMIAAAVSAKRRR